MIKTIFEIILPSHIANTLRGVKIPFYVFALYAILSTERSCIHLLAPDGGAGSIAGMDLSVAGADGIIFAFALWGSSQLLFALIQLLVVFRYRSLVPFMWLMLILEMLLRELVRATKLVTFAHIPPGAIGNQLFLPLATLMLVWSVWSANQKKKCAMKITGLVIALVQLFDIILHAASNQLEPLRVSSNLVILHWLAITVSGRLNRPLAKVG